VTAVASNYQLTGVVSSGREGVAILVADGQPPKAVQVGREISPGVTLSEVLPRYVMLSEGGVMKRIELATDAHPAAEMLPPGGMPGSPPPMMPTQPMPAPAPQAPQPMPQQTMPAPMAQPMGSTAPEPEPAPVEAPPPEGVPQPSQALPPGVSPSPPGVRMPMPNRNFMPNPSSSR
jgi:general secretion pathway protein C